MNEVRCACYTPKPKLLLSSETAQQNRHAPNVLARDSFILSTLSLSLSLFSHRHRERKRETHTHTNKQKHKHPFFFLSLTCCIPSLCHAYYTSCCFFPSLWYFPLLPFPCFFCFLFLLTYPTTLYILLPPSIC